MHTLAATFNKVGNVRVNKKSGGQGESVHFVDVKGIIDTLLSTNLPIFRIMISSALGLLD